MRVSNVRMWIKLCTISFFSGRIGCRFGTDIVDKEDGFVNNQSKKSNFLWIVLAIAVVLVGGYSLFFNGPEHIEDTNGASNFNLAVITKENVINRDLGALGLSKSTGFLNDGITFSSKKFSGVMTIFETNFLFDSTFTMDVLNFHVNQGNFKMYVVYEDEIAAEVEPDTFAECRLDGLNGHLMLVIAGESADFSFTLDQAFCNQYDIKVGN